MICFDNKIVYVYANVVSPHLHDLNKYARKHICVAIKRQVQLDHVGRDYLYHGAFSFCNPKDQFVKKIARTISSNRLTHQAHNSKVVCPIVASKDNSFLEVLKAMFESPTFTSVCPNWLKDILLHQDGVIVDTLGNELLSGESLRNDDLHLFV